MDFQHRTSLQIVERADLTTYYLYFSSVKDKFQPSPELSQRNKLPQAVIVGNVGTISGQSGWDPLGNMVPSARKQVELALKNAETASQAAGNPSQESQQAISSPLDSPTIQIQVPSCFRR